MVTVKAHFDGKVFVPDEPVSLPHGAEARVLVDERPGVPTPTIPLTPAARITPVLTGLDPAIARAIGQEKEFDLENA